MNVNKVQLGAQLVMKEEMALKCMEFATQYMLKKAEYRILNPLHPIQFDIRQLHSQSQLMAELNAYTFVKQPASLNKKSKINDQLSKTSIQNRNVSQAKQQEPKNLQKKEPQKIQKQKPKPQPQIKDEKPFFDQQPQHVVFIRTSSEVLQKQSLKGSSGSKKNKSKFQIVKKTTKSKLQSQNFPAGQFGFKKKKTILSDQTPIKESPIANKIDTQSDSDDSFNNFPLASSQHNEQNPKHSQAERLNASDCKSYHSSILGQKKIDIDVVSEHPSEHQISYLSIGTILRPQIKYQKPNSALNQKPLNQKVDLPSEKDPKHEIEYQQTQQEIRNYLIKLESFQVQQQMLLKKLTKVWTKESECIKKIKQLKWNDLNLPKPSFRFDSFQYADIIE